MATGIPEFFKELFQYNHQCNQQLAELIVDKENVLTQKTFSLFSHILNAHNIWNSRVLNQPHFGVWDMQEPQRYLQIADNNHEQSTGIITTHAMEEVITYSNARGQHSKCLRDILFHVINHSNYHRAQIATECKNAGLAPLSTDFILFAK